MRTDLVATIVLAMVVAAAIAVVRRQGQAGHRRAVNGFIAALAGAGLAAGLVQWELYPFSAWPLVAATVPDSFVLPRLVLLDQNGTEHEFDYRASRPFPFAEFMSWLDLRFPALPRTTQDSAAAWIVARADAIRARARAGAGVPEYGHLGPVGAPFFLLHPRRWDAPANAPAERFVGLRLYRERWLVGSKASGVAPRRTLRYEWPRPT